MPDNLYCDQTTPWQGVYFFTNTVCREIDTLYTFLFYCVVTTHFTLDSKLNSSIHCSIWKSNFQVSEAKLLLQESVLECSKVSSGSEKMLHQIDQSECNIFCQNISNSNINLNWYKDQPFSDWYIYKPVDMPHKWIGSTPK